MAGPTGIYTLCRLPYPASLLQTDPEPWHGEPSPSRDLLGFPVTHSCPAAEFPSLLIPRLLDTQREFQEMSGQLVLIPELIPSGSWERCLLFTYCVQCGREVSVRGCVQSLRMALGDFLMWHSQKVILRAKCINRGMGTLTPSYLILQQPCNQSWQPLLGSTPP